MTPLLSTRTLRILVALTTLPLTACGGSPSGPRPCVPSAEVGTEVSQELLANTFTTLMNGVNDGSLHSPGSADAVLTTYLWTLYTTRTSRIAAEHRYNPEFTDDLTSNSDENLASLADALALAPRDGATIRRAFADHGAWLFAALPRDRYEGLGLRAYVDDLLHVRAHMLAVPEMAARLDALTPQLEAQRPDPGGVPYPSSINAHSPELYGALFDRSVVHGTDASEARRGLWLHSFWYRRQLEGNACDVAAVLEQIRVHYRSGPQTSASAT